MKGQTLIEVLVALGVSIIVISAIVVSVISALDNSTFSKNQNSATNFAQEGMENMRRLRNTNYAAFSAYQGEYLLNQNATIPTAYPGPSAQACSITTKADSYAPNINSTFKRQLCIEQNSADCKQQGQFTTKVRVDVFWTDGKCTSQNTYCHYSELISCFTSPPGGIGAP